MRQRGPQSVHTDTTLGELLLQQRAHCVVWMEAHGAAKECEGVVDVHPGLIAYPIILLKNRLVVLTVHKRDDFFTDHLSVHVVCLDPE